MTNSPLLSLRNIDKSYSVAGLRTQVLKEISLDIHHGELLAIVGASGSGKSTLMNILGLLDKADSGEYYLETKHVNALNDEALAELRNHYIGFVFQQFNLLPRFTVRQNVALPLSYRRLSATIIEQKVIEALKRVGMHTFLDRKPSQLSGGQQQRVAIARALVTEPQMILADEPTGSLDSQTGKDIVQVFLSLHAEGRTLILVTHDETIAASCPRRLVMHDGELAQPLPDCARRVCSELA